MSSYFHEAPLWAVLYKAISQNRGEISLSSIFSQLQNIKEPPGIFLAMHVAYMPELKGSGFFVYDFKNSKIALLSIVSFNEFYKSLPAETQVITNNFNLPANSNGLCITVFKKDNNMIINLLEERWRLNLTQTVATE